MVWGWVGPRGFGDFFPHGDHVGWEEGLKRYFDEEMAAEQKAAFDNWHVKYMGEVSRKFTEEGRGMLKSHERPTEFRMLEARKSLGSLIALADGLLAVDEGLKEIIERLEPGVHQFWPLRITLPKGGEYPVPYYGMVICRFIDSFVPEQSTVHQVSEGSSSYFTNGPTKQDYAALALSTGAIAGAHLWRERRLRMPDVFFSDELQAVMTRSGLRMAKHHRLKAV
jgi:hypothetical protein